MTDTAIVKSHQLALNQGTKGTSSISSTHDYATVTTTAGFTFYENSSSADAQTYYPTSMALLIGTNLTGGISNLTLVDGICVNFNETNGQPAFDFYFNFTGVSSASSFQYDMYEIYKGNPGHTVEIDLYNFTSSSWIVYEQFNGETVFTWHNNTVTSTNGLIQSGTVMGRLEHISGGSTFHYERIDYIALSTSGYQTNTDFTVPASSDSFTVAAGSSVYLYSPTFTTGRTIYAGSWLLDLWASATSSGTLSVTFNAVNSSNAVVATAASGNTGTIGTSKVEVKTSFSGSQISVPSGGRLVANITNPTGSGITFTIYWGAGQPSNFQTPADYDYVVAITNSATTPFYLNLVAYSSSGISRLTNLTVTIYSPSTNQIIIINGAFTQSSGSTMTLPATSTIYVQVHASANSFGASNVVLLMKYSPSSRPFAYDVINLTIN
ncbi:MAG: hypothetical protein ACQCN5_05180 [Candidatus Bathyarchaeia archaeon]